jgi:hypothetical protein
MKAPKAAKAAERFEDDEPLLTRLEKEGLVRRGKGGPIPPELLLPGPKCRATSVLDAVVDERRSGR